MRSGGSWTRGERGVWGGAGQVWWVSTPAPTAGHWPRDVLGQTLAESEGGPPVLARLGHHEFPSRGKRAARFSGMCTGWFHISWRVPLVKDTSAEQINSHHFQTSRIQVASTTAHYWLRKSIGTLFNESSHIIELKHLWFLRREIMNNFFCSFFSQSKK